MPAPAGFSDLMARKYDILQQNASSESQLRQAQATAMASSTPFENALKAAQANQTNAQANTVAPLAKASIASTMAGANEAGARSGLYGAQAGQMRDEMQPLGVLGELGGRLAYQLSQAQNRQTPGQGYVDSMGNYHAPGFAEGTSNVPAPDKAPPVAAPVAFPLPAGTPASTFGKRTSLTGTVAGYADGTSDVQVSGGGGFGSAQQQGLTPVTGMGQAVLAPPTNRAPGASQMEGSGFGSTTGPGGGAAAPGAHTLDLTGSNRLAPGAYSTDGKIGLATAPASGIRIDPTTGLPIGGFAKGTARVPGKGAPAKGKSAPAKGAPSAADSAAPVAALLQALMGGQGGAQPAPQAAPMAAPPGGAPAAAPGGLAGMLAAAMGANLVPGKGSGRVDTVPAMLAPGEAVVNKAAIKHLPGGRKEIAKANRAGVKDMKRGAPAKKVALNHAAGKSHLPVAVHVKVG